MNSEWDGARRAWVGAYPTEPVAIYERRRPREYTEYTRYYDDKEMLVPYVDGYPAYAQGSPGQGKLIETVKPDGTKIYELKESPIELPMEGVDPEIEKHV